MGVKQDVAAPIGARTGGIRLIASILDTLEAPAIIIDRDRRIVAANEAYTREISVGEPVLGRTCHEVSHDCATPCDLAGSSCPIQKCQQTGQPQRAVHVHYTPRGEEREEIHAYPMRDETGEISRFLEFVRPFGDRRPNGAGPALVGRSASFLEMLNMVDRVAPTETTVLLLGESGTGKELVAHRSHKASSRASGPFVPLDCSGLNESLFESEFFGHEKGAFTGATVRKVGLVESARGGTLFLDEVGDIPLAQQVKLLRLLETGLYRRVGSTEAIRADHRLVCATHRDLKKMIISGEFRADLYYRLSAFPLVLPPLRERIDDLPLLIEHVLDRIGSGSRCRFSPCALELLMRYDFPGNVRELINMIERGCLLADDHLILAEHLPADVRTSETRRDDHAPKGEIVPLSEAEDLYVSWALEHFPGTHRSLARRLGVSERTLYRRAQRLRTGSSADSEPENCGGDDDGHGPGAKGSRSTPELA